MTEMADNDGQLSIKDIEAISAAQVARLGIEPGVMAGGLFEAARVRVRAMRASGMAPDHVREIVEEMLLGGDRGDPERLPTWQEAVEAGVLRGLADRPRKPLDPLSRQRGSNVLGVPIVLADGEPWIFPALRLERGMWTTPAGRERGGYLFERTEFGDRAGRVLPALATMFYAVGLGSVPMSEIFAPMHRFFSIILKEHYRITFSEASRLMPIDMSNRHCVAEIAAMASGCGVESFRSGVIQITGQVERLSEIRLSLTEYLYPLLCDMASREGEVSDGKTD